jgi:chloramphenicol 3-O phosphotransferase
MRDAFFLGFERSLTAYAETGNNLIVEYIIETGEWMQRLVTTLHRSDVFFVGVQCPLDELERRERARGDRPIGDARRDFFTVHAHAEYDFEVDGTALPEQNADLIIKAWVKRSGASAFSRRAGVVTDEARHPSHKTSQPE